MLLDFFYFFKFNPVSFIRRMMGNSTNVAATMSNMTFHAACLRMLRQDAGILGYKPDFTVYDPVDQKAVVKAIVKEHQIDDKKFPVQMLLSVISDCKEKELNPEQYIASFGRDFKTEIIYKVYQDYQRILKKNNAMRIACPFISLIQ